jgi:hypothetical protein
MKRLLFGIVLILAVTALADTSAMPQVATSANGRFQIVINPNLRADTFLLDSATGRTWKPVQWTDVQGSPVVWEFQERVDDDAALSRWLGSRQFLSKDK